MVTNKRLFTPIIAAVFVLSVIAVPQLARAEDNHGGSNTSVSGSSSGENASEQAKKLADQRKEIEQKRQNDLHAEQEKRQEELHKKSQAEQEKQKQKDEAFTKVCDERKDHFKTRLGDIRTKADKQLATLDTITDRVDAYKTSKNLAVANYAALLADVKTKRQIVHDLHETLAQKAAAFDCGSTPDQAKASLAAYKDAFQQELDAFKAYKTSVKTLIAAVKAAATAANQGGTGNEHN